MEGAEVAAEEGLKLGNLVGIESTRKASFLRILGTTARIGGDHEHTKVLYEEGLVLSRELGGAQPLGDSLLALGYEYLLEGDHRRATALNEEAAAWLRERGHKGDLQYALDNLAWAALLRGDHERARELHDGSRLAVQA